MSTELVKSLSMNTSVEAVDKLVEQSAEWKTAFGDMSREVRGAATTSSTVGNKCDQLKHEIAELKKRLVKLEQKR